MTKAGVHFSKCVCIYLLILNFISYSCFGQDLSGYWEGEIAYNDSLVSNCFDIDFYTNVRRTDFGVSSRVYKYNRFRGNFARVELRGDMINDSIFFRDTHLKELVGNKIWCSKIYKGKVIVDLKQNQYIIDGAWKATILYNVESSTYTSLSKNIGGHFKVTKKMLLPQAITRLPYIKIDIESLFLPENYSQFDEIINLLKTNPNLKIQVEAHAAHIDNSWSNILTTQSTAERARNYMFRKDRTIHPHRIIAIGYGDLFIPRPIPYSSKETIIVSYWEDKPKN